jgi:hypothetical protein
MFLSAFLGSLAGSLLVLVVTSLFLVYSMRRDYQKRLNAEQQRQQVRAANLAKIFESLKKSREEMLDSDPALGVPKVNPGNGEIN